MTRKLLRLGLVAFLASCAAAPPPARVELGTDAEEEPPRERSAGFPGGLVPCPKDAPPGEGCAVRPRSPQPDGGAGEERAIWKVTVGPDDPVRGSPDALVTVVVFSDFECPFCKRGAESLERLAIDYPAEVRIVWKDLPLDVHPHARPAAELARAARVRGGDKTFWAAHDRLFENQAKLGDATFRRIARELDVPWTSAAAAVRAARFGGVIRAASLLADRVGVEATPTLFVNGRKLVGSQPYEKLRALVDSTLAEANRLAGSGTPRSQIYARVTEGGREITVPAADAPAVPAVPDRADSPVP